MEGTLQLDRHTCPDGTHGERARMTYG